MNIENRYIPVSQIEVRDAVEGEAKRISGYAAKFNQLSEPLYGFREKIAPGAFLDTLQKGETVRAFWNHNSDMVLGSTRNNTLTLAEDEIGLRFELELPDTTAGHDAFESIRRGDVDGVSFGFTTELDEWDSNDKNNIVRTLKQVRLFEVSPTPMPAYPQTSVSARSAEAVFNEYKATEENEIRQIRKRQLALLSLLEQEC